MGVYGGCFGGAVGIVMLAVWSLFGTADLRRMNAARTTLAMAANGAAVLCLMAAGRVGLERGGAAGRRSGGGQSYGGAQLARRADMAILRAGITALGAAMTAVLFLRALR